MFHAPCGLTYRYKRTHEIFAELEIYQQILKSNYHNTTNILLKIPLLSPT